MKPRLVTIPLSHYCERARWALDLCSVDYVEEQHLQMFAGRKTRSLGATKTAPVLVVDGEVLADSADIVRWASAQSSGDVLYPGSVDRAEIEALEAEFAGRYGVETRRLAYDWFFRNLEPCLAYNEGAAPRYQAWALRLTKNWVVPWMVRYLGLSPEKITEGRDVVRQQLDAVGKRLADGRPFLLGDVFTAADLTFAAMTAVCVLPPQYGTPLPPTDVLDEDGRQWVADTREHPAGQFALRLYERRPPVRAQHLREHAPIPDASTPA